MHLLGRTDDRIDRARLDAQRAADTSLLVDERHRFRLLDRRSARLVLAPEHFRQFAHAIVAARRAQVDLGLAAGNGLGIRLAARITALGALGLRQDGVDLLGQRIPLDLEVNGGIAQRRAERKGYSCHNKKGGEHRSENLKIRRQGDDSAQRCAVSGVEAIQSGKAHEGKAHETGSHHGDRHATERRWHIGPFEPFADTGEQNQGKGETDGGTEPEQQ